MALRLYFLTVVFSLLAGFLVFFLFSFEPAETGEGYALVTVDASWNDRRIGELLNSESSAGGYISQSTQWVYIDDFGELKKIPLDSYREEVEAFDPRNDGFGERFASFFVRDGKRFFFIPLEDSSKGLKKRKEDIAAALGDIPFVFEVLSPSRPFFWYFILLGAAAFGALFFAGRVSRFIFQIPLLLAFGRGGPQALVQAAFLASLWALFRDPLRELFASRLYRCGGGAGEKLKPYRLNLILAFVFLILLSFITGIGEGSPLPVCAGLLSSWGLLFLSMISESAREKKAGHVRFTPAPLFPAKAAPLFPFIAVFGSAALLSLVAPLFFPSFSPPRRRSREAPSVLESEFLISPAEYEAHVSFQSSFSRRSLGSEDSAHEGYFHYYLGGDGLIGGEEEYPREETRTPSFPLEKLMEFLLQYNNTAGEKNPARFKEWISVILILASGIPVFFINYKAASPFGSLT